MADYNLGTASGRIVVDGSGAELGFNVAKTAAGAFFDVVKARVSEVQKLGRRMAAVGGAGVAGFGAAIKTAADFEQQMSGVYAVANANEQQMEQLRQKALDLGKDTVYSASEAANALEELVKAGISVDDAINGAADAAVALAAAGGVSIPEAATIAANAMNQFELSAKQMPKVADILSGVANTSASDVSGIGQSLQQAGAVANLAGLSFRDTAIAIGEMADAGIRGSDSGTSLKTFLNNLIPATDKQSSKFKELGLLEYNLVDANKTLAHENLKTAKTMDEAKKRLSKYVEELGKGEVGTAKNAKAVDDFLLKMGGLDNKFFDAQGNVKNLAGLQDTLAKALKGQTREQKLSNLEILFGADAMRASAILSLAAKDGYKKFNAEVKKTSAADVAKVRLDNLAGAVEQFKGSVQTVAIEVGSIFLPLITRIVQFLTLLLNKFIELPKGVKVALAILAALVSSGFLVIGMILAMLPLIISMIANFLLMRVIGTVTSGFLTFFRTLRGGQGVMAATRVSAATTATSMRTLSLRTLFAGKTFLLFGKMARAAWVMATGPIGIAIAAIAALVALGVILYKRWEPFRNLVDKIAAFLREQFARAVEYLTPIFFKVLDALKRFGEYVKATLLPVLQKVGAEIVQKFLQGFQKVWAAIQTQLLPAVDKLVDAFQNDVVPAMAGLWKVSKPILKALGAIALIVGGILLKVLVELGKVFITYILPILIKVAGFIVGVLIDTLVTLVTGAIQAVTGLITIFTGLINFFKAVFTGDWAGAWDAIKQIMSGALDLIIGLIKVFFSIGVFKLFGLGFRGIMALVQLGWRGILALFRASGRGLINLVKAPFKLIWTIIRGAFNLVRAIVRAGWNFVRGLFQNAGGTLRSIVSKMWTAIKNFFTTGGRNVITAVQKAWTAVRTKTGEFIQALIRRVWNGLKNIVQFFKDLPGRVLRGMGKLGEYLLEAGKDLMRGLLNGIKSMAGEVAGAAKDVAKGAVGAVTGFLHIGSPSKLMIEKGEDTGGGLGIGIEKSEKDVVRSAFKVAKAAALSIKAGLDRSAIRSMDRVITATATPSAPVLTAAGSRTTVKNIKIDVHNPRPERAGKSVSKSIREEQEEEGWM